MVMFETLNDALIACVKAVGGSKVLGLVLWPELGTEQAARKLCDCLNPERPHKLSQEQVLLLFKRARDVGYHEGMAYFCQQAGYAAPVPLEPGAELADLQRKILAMGDDLAKALQGLAALQKMAS